MITKLLAGFADRRARRGRPPVASEAATITVEYAPRHDGAPDPGEVVWTWVAFEDDPAQGKDRPVVIIGRSSAQLVGIALTTKDHGPAGDRIAVGTGDWDRERRPSFAKIDRILVMDVDAVRREGAAFDRARFDVLVEAVRRRHPGTLGVDAAGALPARGRR
jgi:hypothetical protein